VIVRNSGKELAAIAFLDDTGCVEADAHMTA
jgi:hypothetical protein